MSRQKKIQVPDLTVEEIRDLLAHRHWQGVFVPECKTGSTWMSHHRRLDAWACRASWANPQMTGYEIKLSRSDWRADTKWPEYLEVCERFYFVCPAGLIAPQEIDERAGLIWAYPNRLRTVRAAPWTAHDWPGHLLAYILLCRSRITDKPQVGILAESRNDPEQLREWLAGKRRATEIGGQVGRKIGDLQREIRDLKLELSYLERNSVERTAQP